MKHGLLKAVALSMIVGLIGITAPASADDSAETKKVIGAHLAAFGSGDVKAILGNFAEDAVIIVPGAIKRGHAEIGPMFEGLVEEFGQPDVTFELTHQAAQGNVGFIVWKAETGNNVYELGTDTFVVEDGKIVTQTVAAKTTPK